tara:strand:+ start:186 stop:947 length:762 start_codon:yes stop_codon:yes gene_type:complete
MALNWKNAQINEKKFWKDVYVKNAKDDVYGKTPDEGWTSFTLQIFKRHDLDINYLNGKIVLDLGSGPGGVARGIQVLSEKNEINNCSIIAIDPLMDFYKKEIGILKENKFTKLLTNQGEKINLPDNSVDIIFSTNVLDHCDNPDDVIKECFRILKPGGLFYPSMHLIYDYLTLFSKFIKYFDTNHPHHFTIKQIEKKFNKKFFNHKVNNKFPIKHDQSEFNFLNIFKSKNKLRSIKRYLSNFVLYTCYFTLRK